MNNTTIIIILVALVASYSFFSATETAFSSLNKIKIKTLANTGNTRAIKTLKLLDDFTRLLTTILIGNTIVNVVSASIATVLFTNIYHGNGVAISSVVMTLVIMIIGEILPKTIAKKCPEKFALSATPLMNILIFIFTPLTYIFTKLEDIIDKLIKKGDDSEYNSDEFITLVEEAQEDGEIKEEQADLITNAIEFDDLDVGEIFTPRIDIVSVDIDKDNIKDIEIRFRDSGFSRLPVYKGTIDNIIGVLIEKDFYYYLNFEKSYKELIDIVKPVIYTSGQVKISSLLKELQTKKVHLAIVADEYGGTEGLITMEDILEELVGEIYDEHDEVVEYYKKVADNSYLIKGDLDIEEMFDHFDIECNEEFEFNTVSAWVIDQFDRIPSVGDKFTYKNYDIEVTDADNKLVNEIKFTINEKGKDEE